jgi:hypothetical protein
VCQSGEKTAPSKVILGPNFFNLNFMKLMKLMKLITKYY